MKERLSAAVSRAGATLRTGVRPGDIGQLIRLHGDLYAREHGYSLAFEAYVAKTFSAYCWPLSDRERLWLVEVRGALCGSIAIVKASEREAQLRWLLLQPRLRGYGIGRALVEEAVAFSRANGYATVLLWTEGSLAAATSLYKSAGFSLTESSTSSLWGAVRTEERYDLRIS